MSSSFRFLCAADLHLGREVSLTKGLGDRFSTSEGWDALIALACAKQGEIEALLIAGDLLDREDLFSTFLPLIREGVERLAKAKIPLIAVARNHDPTVIIKIAETIGSPYFTVLGKGGEWQSHLLPCGVRIDGWSFPAIHHPSSPFVGVPKGDTGLCIGIVHTDWDGGEKSPFAPSSRSISQRQGTNFGFLATSTILESSIQIPSHSMPDRPLLSTARKRGRGAPISSKSPRRAPRKESFIPSLAFSLRQLF